MIHKCITPFPSIIYRLYMIGFTSYANGNLSDPSTLTRGLQKFTDIQKWKQYQHNKLLIIYQKDFLPA